MLKNMGQLELLQVWVGRSVRVCKKCKSLRSGWLAWRLVLVKAGESADENSRVRHAVLKASTAGYSEQSRLRPPPQT